ncbi:MAG: trigger factor [Odoribacteraceae bacterium]|jgi:trigger factor|nr:trigger factor [Odoribacteraceae bacterium]
MNITRNTIDSLHGTIQVEIVKEDYAGNVEKVLKDYQRKVVMDGFRKGKTPFGIIKKMYEKAVLLEELNKLLADQLTSYIHDNQLHILGEPLPSKEQKEINLDEERYEFLYDIAYVPAMNVQLSKREKIPFYTIKVDEEMIDKELAEILKNNGELIDVETIEGTEYLKGELVELEAGGEAKEGGLRNERVTLSVAYIQDSAARENFLGATVGSRVIFNPAKAYPNKTDFAAMLGVDKEEAEKITADFSLTIHEIKRRVDAEPNQALFDKLYGAGVVHNVEELRGRIKGELESQFSGHSNYRFTIDARDKMLRKNEEVALPEDFLKRWIVATNEKVTEEAVEEDFASYRDAFKWQLIKSAVIRENDLQVTEEDIKEVARDMAASQLQRYGLYHLLPEQLDTFAARLLEDKEQREHLREKAQENRVFAHIKESVKLDDHAISLDDFGKLFEDKK